jgi:hypothetical protein
MAKQNLSDELSELLKPSPLVIAHHYVNSAHGRQDAKLVEANAKKLLALGSGVSLSCEVIGEPFGIVVKVKNGPTFTGYGGPFLGPISAVIYTEDVNKLYQAQQFSFVSSPVFFSFIFYDGDGNAVGYLQAGSVSIIAGSGAGYGVWSNPSSVALVVKPSPQLIANHYVSCAYGHHDAKLMESNVKKLVALHSTAKPAAAAAEAAPAEAAPAAATSYPGHGSIASLIFGFKVQVELNRGKSITGWAGGIGTPGGGVGFGDVYTDNINTLYSKTVSFSFVSAIAYFTVIFYDNDGNILGSFQSGGVSTVVATGKGSATWQ